MVAVSLFNKEDIDPVSGTSNDTIIIVISCAPLKEYQTIAVRHTSMTHIIIAAALWGITARASAAARAHNYSAKECSTTTTRKSRNNEKVIGENYRKIGWIMRWTGIIKVVRLGEWKNISANFAVLGTGGHLMLFKLILMPRLHTLKGRVLVFRLNISNPGDSTITASRTTCLCLFYCTSAALENRSSSMTRFFTTIPRKKANVHSLKGISCYY